ncbi:MAG TPA: DUF547 domain-containing protein [Bryobacteraceae bacterium]|nr:DUF547 domain-containing protein [Bryobacteraceae bacterium]
MTSAQTRPFDHSLWSDLLRAYVTRESRVDYRSLKAHGAASLDRYLQQLAAPWPPTITPDARKAALINSYNALTVRWVAANYPVASIWRTRHPFTEARHTVDGAATSLDQIEGRLRAMGDPRIHAALVCAARSCPPLRQEAYDGSRLDSQLDDNTRAWLANPNLNQFFPARNRASVSMIFKWYQADFGSVEKFLARFGHPAAQLEYKPYDWGLNDSSGAGNAYCDLYFYWDAFRNKIF